jgi:peptidoglycan/xylan/chitin deacetylase (PgdA/CDA1 family)
MVAGLVVVAFAVVLVVLASSSGGGHRSSRARIASGTSPSPARHRSSQPDRAAVMSVLGYAPAIRKGGDHVKDVALTFDDGPGPDTPRIAAELRRFHAPATFFVLGRSALTAEGKRRLRDLAADGDVAIGDHTMTHPALAGLSAAGQRREISGLARLLTSMGVPRPVVFRPPFGSFNATTLGVLRRERMLGVLWTADTKDYSRPGKKQIIYTAVSAAQPGAILLMHDGPSGRSETAAALPRIIIRLRQRGYRLVTVPEMMRENPPPHGTAVPTSLAGD